MTVKREVVVEKQWTTKEGFAAGVLFIDNSHRCGYVGVDKNHWSFGLSYDEMMIVSVHGGLTFCGDNSLLDEEKEFWWFGYDCAHSGDKTKYNSDGVVRTLEYCIEECESLSEQIKNLEHTSFAYLNMSKGNKLSEDLHNKMLMLALQKDKYAIEYINSLNK